MMHYRFCVSLNSNPSVFMPAHLPFQIASAIIAACHISCLSDAGKVCRHGPAPLIGAGLIQNSFQVAAGETANTMGEYVHESS